MRMLKYAQIRFNGKLYNYYGGLCSKAYGQRVVSRLHKEGWLARLVKASKRQGGTDMYNIYYRRK